jgi:hypothetical protein
MFKLECLERFGPYLTSGSSPSKTRGVNFSWGIHYKFRGGKYMKKTQFLHGIACVSLALASAFAQQKASSAGTWKLDLAQSDFGSDPAFKSVTINILKDTPQMLSWRVHLVDDKGKPSSYSWSGPEDGSMHPIIETGKSSDSQESAKKDADGTLIRHGESTDGSSFDARATVSADGNTITDQIVGKSKDGKENKAKYVYHRAAATSASPDKKPAS